MKKILLGLFLCLLVFNNSNAQFSCGSGFCNGGKANGLLAFSQNYAQIGDSVIWAQSSTAPPPQQSITQIGQWLNGFSGGRLKLVTNFNQGVGGETSVQVAARFTTSLTPLNPKVVLANGGINDLLSSVSATTVLTAWDSMISQAATMGVYLIVLPPLPTSSLTGPQETQRQLVVAGLNARASSTVLVIDITGYDFTTMDYAQQGTGVRIHPNIIGAQFLAAKAATIAGNIIQAGNGLLTASNPLNKAVNGYFTGTSGTLGGLATGQLADTCNVSTNTVKGNLTLALSKSVRSSGGSWQNAVFGGTYIYNSNDLNLVCGSATTGLLANQSVTMSMDVQVDSGAVNIDGLNFFVLMFANDFSVNVTSSVFYVNTTEHQGGYGTPQSNYIVQSEPFSLPAGKVPGQINVIISPNLNQDAAANSNAAISFRIGSLGISQFQ